MPLEIDTMLLLCAKKYTVDPRLSGLCRGEPVRSSELSAQGNLLDERTISFSTQLFRVESVLI